MTHDPHIEIVTDDADQPVHNRIVAGNERYTWTTESFVDDTSARRSIVALGELFSPVGKATLYADHLHVHLDDQELGEKIAIPVLTVDERLLPRHGGL